MATTIYVHPDLAIPLDIQSLADFRRWTLSPAFPSACRIDFVRDRIEVDMSPEDLFCHGTLKTAVTGGLQRVIAAEQLGALFSDCTRVSVPSAELSVEPDILFLARTSLVAQRVRLIQKSTGEQGRFVEIEGPPDLIIEILSDSSEDKDQRRLPPAYAEAGVRELWLLDARGDEMFFQIHSLQGEQYQPVASDSEGFQTSTVFARRFRIVRSEDDVFFWRFELQDRPVSSRV